MTNKQRVIKQAVKRAFKEYGLTLKLLSDEDSLLEEGKRLAIEENEEAFGLLGVKDYKVYLRRRAEHIEHLRKLRGKEEYGKESK